LALLACNAVGGASGLDPRGAYVPGVLCVVSALGTGAVLLWGLHIPDDPSIDRNMLLLERLTVVRSARGGHSYPPITDSPRKAEEIAAAFGTAALAGTGVTEEPDPAGAGNDQESPEQDDGEKLAKVIPLSIFDPFEEAKKPW
jgi:hypothetical protein